MTESFLSPCIQAVGPSDAKLAFIGEAPGEQEEMVGFPFVGRAGQELDSMAEEAGITLSSTYRTNVLFTRPPGNKLDAFLIPKKACPPSYSLPMLKAGNYLHPSLIPELSRLREELETLRPNLAVALGNTATWALLGSGKISSARGTVAESSLIPGLKVLPTYHPAAVLRNWTWRVIVIQDLIKAKREMEFPEIRRVERRITINPTLGEVDAFVSEALASPILSCDIETERRQITTIGFATSPSRSFVIPFWDKTKPGYSYWSESEETIVWSVIATILTTHPRVLFQNGLYDTQHLFRMGIPIPGFRDDTMILHHALFPELPKSLEFLGSIYTNELSWKKMRPRHGAGETKREE